jgi:hypothetical protein
MNKNNMFLLCFLSFAVTSPIIAEREELNRPEELAPWEDAKKHHGSDCDSVVLRIRDICAKNISAECLRTDRIHNRHGIVTNHLCAHSVAAKTIRTDNLCVNNKIAFGALSTLAIEGDLCVSGLINQNEVCQLYRATVDYSTSAVIYTLGTPLTFNNIIDDPNNNVTLAPVFMYTAPATGYYIVNVQINQNTLVTATQILGVPNSYIDLLVNGAVVRVSSYPYLSFANEGNGVLAALILLNEGDQVQADYRISFVSPTVGLTNVVGTVTMVGGPANSVFSIHYLSSSACSTVTGMCSAVDSSVDNICDTTCIPEYCS